jgi:heterodisulfide reductase subunit B
VKHLKAAADEPDRVFHVLGLFARADVRERLAAKITETGQKRPVGSLKVVCFYGGEFAAPSQAAPAGEGAPAGPMESLMQLAGAHVIEWEGKERACGAFTVFSNPEAAFGRMEKIFRDFEKSSADAIVTACPHCHFNLDAFEYTIGRRRRKALEVPILHFTEVLALAMEIGRVEKWFGRHVTSPFPLIDRLDEEEERRRLDEQAAEKRAKR